eukprot:TRINITY_DN19626_c0_g1_i5.p1 TRINITY_DN19626_c0_g1~~TRINITY_DN19626_c0_g1_i5.p1  ORF type:complete len:513 (-),score=88.38 TRINITY_DN19626_c0_g1_i5:328-1866(-)
MAARPSLNDLPEEVLIAIFGYLSTEDLVVNIRQTCRRFSHLSRVPGLWGSLTIDDQQSSHHVAMLVGQRCVRASPCDGRDITVAVKDVVTSVQERGSVLPSCSVAGRMFYPKLESISLTRAALISMDFLSKYHALRRLSVNVTSYGQELVGKKYLAGAFRVLKNLTQLKTLSFLWDDEEGEYSLDAATEGAMRDYFMSGPRLTQLTLGICDVEEDTVKAVVDHCTELQKLVLEKCYPKLTSRTFAAASKRSSLYSLQLATCPGLDDKCLKSLAVTFPDLRYLELHLTSKTSDEGLAFLFQACPGLDALRLIAPDPEEEDSTTDNGDDSAASAGKALTGRCLRQFARRESKGKLQRLHLVHFQSLDGHAFRALCENQPNLRDAQLDQRGVSEDDVLFMVKHCQRLTSFQIKNCPQVGSRVAGPVMTLPRLTIAACPAVGRVEDLLPSTKRARSGIDTHSSNRDSILESLSINPCSDVTPRGLSAMLSLCPNIVRLVIHADVSVDDDCVRTILR